MRRLIVNITTTHNRLDLCSQTIWSLLNQEQMPTKVIVWVSAEPYMMDEGINVSPTWVEQLNSIKEIVEFRWTENIGPYRKIIPALRSAEPEDILFYADDDTIYSPSWLRLLLQTYDIYGGRSVTASRVKLVKRNALGKIITYMLWPVCKTERSFAGDCLITGVGGAVLQKRHIKESFLLDNSFLALSPRADDVWLSEIISRSGSEIVSCPDAMEAYRTIEHPNGLTNVNLVGGTGFLRRAINKLKINTLGRLGHPICGNDFAIKSVKDYFDQAR